MPAISRFFIKSGMIYFILALIASLLSEVQWSVIPTLQPIYWHMLMVGWITQIIMGVSLWMFPGRSRSEDFKDHLLGWLTFILLNTGLILRFISEPMVAMQAGFAWNILLIISALLQWAAAITYVMELWPRVQSRKKRMQKRKKS